MFRKLFLTFVMSLILTGAAASDTAMPVLAVMGVLISFVVFIAAPRREVKDEKQ